MIGPHPFLPKEKVLTNNGGNMNSLIQIRGSVKKIVLALAIVGSFAVAITAQKVEPQMQGKHYGEPGFVGEPINLNVVNADIRDILSYITDRKSVV